MHYRISSMSLSVTILFILAASAASTAQGLIDPAFGVGGKAVTPVTDGHDFVRRVRIQPDGKIVTLGGTLALNDGPNFGTRHNAHGTLDTSFGVNGKITINSGVVGLSDFDIAPNGIMVFTGKGFNDLGEPATVLYCIQTNGSHSPCSEGGIDNCPGRKILAQPDGKFVVVMVCDYTPANTLSVMRYKPDGSFDAEFGSILGIAAVGLPVFGHTQHYGGLGAVMDFVGDALLQPDGKIIVSAHSGANVVLVRLNTNGTLDASFGDDGYAHASSPVFGFKHPTGIALQHDGKIIVSGVDAEFGVYRSFIFRLDADGSIDEIFGTNGWVFIDEPNPDSRGLGCAGRSAQRQDNSGRILERELRPRPV